MAEQYPFGLSELNKELGWEGEEALAENDIEEIKANLPQRPSFPIFTFFCALLKDFIDIASLGILGIFTNIIIWIVISVYLWGKVGFVKKLLYRRIIFVIILEFIPFINMIPQWSVFVLRGYFGERKKVNQVLEAIESLIKAISGGKIETIKHFTKLAT